MQLLFLILAFVFGCSTTTVQTKSDTPQVQPQKIPAEKQVDSKCLLIDCVEGSKCVNGACVATLQKAKVDRCAKKRCAKGSVCKDGRCVSTVTQQNNNQQYVDDCGCGCCGKPMKEVCLNSQAELEQKKAKLAEAAKMRSGTLCARVGCSAGVRYKLCK